MAKTEKSNTGSQVFLTAEVQERMRDLQFKLSTLDQKNFQIYSGKGGLSKVVSQALTALEQRLEKSGHSQG